MLLLELHYIARAGHYGDIHIILTGHDNAYYYFIHVLVNRYKAIFDLV